MDKRVEAAAKALIAHIPTPTPWALMSDGERVEAISVASAILTAADAAAPQAGPSGHLDLFKAASEWAEAMQRKITPDMVELLGWLTDAANAWAEKVEAQVVDAAAPPAGGAVPEFSEIEDEVYLRRAISVMEDTLTDIEDWEDKELSKAIESSLVDLRSMVECIRMRADPNYVPQSPFEKLAATPPTPAQPANSAVRDEREAFEAFFSESRRSRGAGKRPTFDRFEDGTYKDDHTQRHWWTWQQARAALPSAVREVTDAEIDALMPPVAFCRAGDVVGPAATMVGLTCESRLYTAEQVRATVRAALASLGAWGGV